MIRNTFFYSVPHLSGLLIPVGTLILLVGALAAVRLRHRDLSFLWCLSASSILLTNNQLITGLQIQNWHWAYIWGPSLFVLLVLLVVDEILQQPAEIRRIAGAVGIGLLIFTITSGIFLRITEATETAESAKLTRSYDALKEGAPPPPDRCSNGVAAGDQVFEYFASISWRARPLGGYWATQDPDLDDTDVANRFALDAYLRGLDEKTFAQQEENFWHGADIYTPGTPEFLHKRIDQAVDAYREVAANPVYWMRHFGVECVGISDPDALPASARAELNEVYSGGNWQIFRRATEASSASSSK
jgi:hypothetical protein